jgi:hypothetical protein
MDAKNALSKLMNDCHIPIALVVMAVTTGYHFYTHLDLGPNYVDSIKFFYLFLAGHATAYQVWPDKSGPSSSPGVGQ